MLRKLYKRISNRIKNIVDKINGEAIIVLYHRIEDTQDDPLMLCVSKKNFEDQISYLKDKYDIVSLSNIVENIISKKSNRGKMAITFDDGYSDNLLNALPILRKYCIPATIFVTSGYVGSNKPFYWDEESKIKNPGRCMTKEELLLISNNGLIEIGAHTVTHPHLGQISENDAQKEILQSKKNIENNINKNVLGFAYPFGTEEDCTPSARKYVLDSGYKYACANIKGYVRKNSDKYMLPRILARNWEIDDFKKYF